MLSALHGIERILGDADGPLTLREIWKRMPAEAAARSTVRQAIEELKRRGLVVEGSEGVVWVLNLSPEIRPVKWREL